MECLFDDGIEVHQRDVIFHIGEEGHDSFKAALVANAKRKGELS